jgi:hypothetical protein
MLPVVHRKRAVACTVRFHGQRTHCASDAGQFQDCVSERFGVLLGQVVAGVRDLAVGVGPVKCAADGVPSVAGTFRRLGRRGR